MELIRCVLGQNIVLRAEWVGEDLSVFCYGGHKAHIGAVSVAFPSAVGDIVRVSVSTLSLPAHREDELSRLIARRFCKETGKTVSVTCGIHYDGIGREEIDEIQQNVLQMTEALIARLFRPTAQ